MRHCRSTAGCPITGDHTDPIILPEMMQCASSASTSGWIWLTGHSAPRLSSELLGSDANLAKPQVHAATRCVAPYGRACGSANLDTDPKNSCAECPNSQLIQAGLVFKVRKPPILAAEGDALGGAAWTWGFAK
jgi:hypothetical protein